MFLLPFALATVLNVLPESSCSINDLRENPKVFIDYLTKEEYAYCAGLSVGYAMAILDIQLGAKKICTGDIRYPLYFELLVEWLNQHQGFWDEPTLLNIISANEEVLSCKKKERKF